MNQNSFLKGCFLLLAAFVALKVQSQEISGAIKIGDTLPNLTFKSIKGKEVGVIDMQPRGQELILLDFWSTTCYECIFMLPKMVEFQKKFGAKVKIVVVTQNTLEEVNSLYKILEGTVPDEIIGARNEIPFIVSDTILQTMFPHPHGLPMHVWIDRENVYRCSAYSTTTTAKNISMFLNGDYPKLASYYFTDVDIMNSKQWFQKRFGDQLPLKSYSMLSVFDKKTSAGGFVNQFRDSIHKKISSIDCINQSVPELYRVAYFPFFKVNYNFLLIESTRKGKLFPPSDLSKHYEWVEENKYCYSARYSSESDSAFYLKMANELDNYFDFDSKIVQRSIKCYILKLKDEGESIVSKSGKAVNDKVYRSKKQYYVLNNMPIIELFNEIFSKFFTLKKEPVPFFNETNFSGNIDLDIPWGDQVSTMDDLRKILKKHGILIEEEYRVLPVVLITDKKNH